MNQSTQDSIQSNLSIASNGGDVAADQAIIYKQHDGTAFVQSQIAGSVNIESRPSYHFYIQRREWLEISLLYVTGWIVLSIILLVVLQWNILWVLALSLACSMIAIGGLWLVYDARQKTKFRLYKKHVCDEMQNLRFFSRQIELEHTYISLRIAPEFQNPTEQTEREAVTRLGQKESRYEQSIEIDGAVARYPALLILGEPGAGKTTLLKHLALRFARAEAALPLFIPLHEFADAANQAEKRGQSLTLLDYLPMALQRAGFAGSDRFLAKKLERGEVVLLLDALDEIPDGADRTQAIQAIDQFIRGHGNNLVVVASRIAVYLATQGRLERFHHAEVLEFTPAQMGQFAHALLSHEEADRLERIFQVKPSLRNVGRNPLLLSVIVMVYERGRSLPERRVDLYEQCLLVLLEQWEKQKPISRVDFDKFPVLDRLRRLEEIAFHFMEKGGAITEDDLIAQVQSQFDISSKREALAFIDEIVRYSGILRQQSIHIYSFWHLSFQEYLSACHLARAIAASGNDTVIPYVSQPRWEETLLFLAGIHKDATELIRLIATHEPDRMRGLARAARCLVDGDQTQPTVRARIIEVLVDYLLQESDASKRQYAESVLTEITLVQEVIAFLRWTLLNETNLVTVARVSWIFARSNTLEVSQAFTQALTTTQEWIRQWLILGALQRLNIAESRETLRKIYSTLAADARALAINAIAATGVAGEVEEFLCEQILKEPDTTVLAVVLHSLLSFVDNMAWVRQLERKTDEQQLYKVARIIVSIPVPNIKRLERVFQVSTKPVLRNSCRYVLDAAQDQRNSVLSATSPAEEVGYAGEIESDRAKSGEGAIEPLADSLFGADLQDEPASPRALGAIIEAFHQAINTNDWALQVLYLTDIAKFQEEQATQVLMDALDQRVAWPARQVAARLLVSKGETQAYSAVLAARSLPPAGFINNQSLETLCESLAAYDPLLQSGALYDWESDLNWSVHHLQSAQATEELAGNEQTVQLLSYIWTPGPRRRRWQSVSLLGERGDQEALPELVQALEEGQEDWELRRRTAIALGQLKNPAATRALQECLVKDKFWAVQAACANALADIGTLHALQSLIVALTQAEPQNRADIVAALRRFPIPLDGILSMEHLQMIGQVARQANGLNWEMYQVMNTLYQDILAKAGLASQPPS